MPLEKLRLLQPTLEHYWRDYNSPHTHQEHIGKQSNIHASLKWQDDGTPNRKWTALWESSFYLEFTTLQCKPVLLFKRVLQHHSVYALDMSTIIVFVYMGLQCIWKQLSSNNSRHTSCLQKGLHAGKRPDLMTSKPDAPSTLGYHWTDCTGTTLADAFAQWPSSGNPVLICIIGTHWNTTGAITTLGCQYDHTGWC